MNRVVFVKEYIKYKYPDLADSFFPVLTEHKGDLIINRSKKACGMEIRLIKALCEAWEFVGESTIDIEKE